MGGINLPWHVWKSEGQLVGAEDQTRVIRLGCKPLYPWHRVHPTGSTGIFLKS